MGPESALTRRALLSGGALFGLTGLLAACGQEAANEATGSTSSATPSETATASASATEASSASATPSPVINRGYSVARKPPMVSTARRTVTAQPKMSPSPAMSLRSTLKPKRVSFT